MAKKVTKKKSEKKETPKKNTKKEPVKKGYFNEFISAINNLIDYLYKSNSKAILKVVIELLILVIFISLLKLPFILFRDLLLSFFDIFGFHGDSLIALFIYRLIDIIYIIFAVVLFIGLFKKRFKDISKRK